MGSQSKELNGRAVSQNSISPIFRKRCLTLLILPVIIIIPTFIITYTKALVARNKAIQETHQRFSKLKEEIYKNIGEDDSVGMDILYMPINDRGPVDDQLALLVYYTLEFDKDDHTVTVNVRALGVYKDIDFFGSGGNIELDINEKRSSQCVFKNGKYIWEGGSGVGIGEGEPTGERSTLAADVEIQTDGVWTDTLTFVVKVKVAYLEFDTEGNTVGIEKDSSNENKKSAGVELLSKSIRHKFELKANLMAPVLYN